MDAKQILYSWCGKNKVGLPNYEFNTGGPKHRMRFRCELRVDSFDYVAVGNSTNKKDAQANAARDFIQFLVRVGRIAPDEVPASLLTGGNLEQPAETKMEDSTERPSGITSLLPGGNLPPHLQAQAEATPREFPAYQRGPPQAYMDRVAEKRRLEESEDCDFNMEIHGNWTMENAKSRLHQFLNTRKINVDYKYQVMGPDHNRLSVHIFLKTLDT